MTCRPSPRTRPRTTARSPFPLRRRLGAAARARPSTTTRWEVPGDDLDTCSRDHSHCVHKKAAWTGDMYVGLGLEGQSLSFCFNYRGSQVHMDPPMIKFHSGAMMIVTEDVCCRSNRYECFNSNIKNQVHLNYYTIFLIWNCAYKVFGLKAMLLNTM